MSGFKANKARSIGRRTCGWQYLFLAFLSLASNSLGAQNSGTYQTFDFASFEVNVLSPYQAVHNTPENKDYVKSLVQEQLEAKGLQLSPSPDMNVNIAVNIRHVLQTRDSYINDPNYHERPPDDWEDDGVYVGQYNLGILTVTLVDGRDQQKLWEGSWSLVLRPKSEKKILRKVKVAVVKIIDKLEVSTLGKIPKSAQ